MKANAVSRKEKMDELMQILQDGIAQLSNSEEFKNYLKVASSFPHYSVRNILMIYAQNPKATYVCGYKAWQKRKRQVRKGEKGIRIFAPYQYTKKKAKASDPDEVATGFRAISVFDISQTEGEDLWDSRVVPRLLEGDCDERLFETAKQIVYDNGFTLDQDDIEVNGRCVYQENRIIIRSGNSMLQKFKTLIHECAHMMMHNFTNTPKESFSPYDELLLLSSDLRETEAESVAFVVCSALGIDTSDYSFSYITLYNCEGSYLPKTLERIKNTSEQFLRILSPEMFQNSEVAA